ncbi:hypothetical protein RB2654_15160 [Rhodobacterales bacterium HTCC2654]|uniref:Uncharacterized protein n=1 Tax=Maritimibacter alkaliphilus HTCC2654 TaxID=314271 RepID=A3VH81_9RHOB|nr:hypothetical protein RB2654_15160 [Rhodobacterales bacterium HTCC2654] [Maritimibacter alkaliphilus HTCC2654]
MGRCTSAGRSAGTRKRFSSRAAFSNRWSRRWPTSPPSSGRRAEM